jgi:hypothetical protein
MFKKLRYYLSDKVQQVEHYRKLPIKQKNSDIYIIEFPKSGITWLSTLIANINLIESHSSQRATFYNIQQLVPDIHMNRNILDAPMWGIPRCRFIKSHFEFCPSYNHVIYLVRNPVSVMSSYYHYNSMLKKFNGTFKEFLNDKRFGLQAWKRHVKSWIFAGDSSQRVHMIRYEDLKENPFEVLKSLYKNLGIKLSERSIDEAIELSSFKNMKLSENFYKSFNPNTSLIFVREGKAKTEIDEPLEQFILDNTKEIRERIGY